MEWLRNRTTRGCRWCGCCGVTKWTVRLFLVGDVGNGWKVLGVWWVLVTMAGESLDNGTLRPVLYLEGVRQEGVYGKGSCGGGWRWVEVGLGVVCV